MGLLSGGERNRVHLAKMLKEGGNLLLLDEPTNDLDTETLSALEAALEDFAGCAVVISHDRFFLDRMATHILAFEGDSHVEWFEGNFQDYEEDKKRRLGRCGRLDWHIIPFMSLIYLLQVQHSTPFSVSASNAVNRCFLDRTNIGNARLDHLEQDLKLHGLQYNDCLAVLFPFYIAAEIPSNIMMKLLRPSIWLTFIMFFWSAAMIAQGFVSNYSGLMATRVFLGVFEGGVRSYTSPIHSVIANNIDSFSLELITTSPSGISDTSAASVWPSSSPLRHWQALSAAYWLEVSRRCLALVDGLHGHGSVCL